tara:strand:- start:216 stop:572 length:357 start_codon:yes stop_codon:yes gene_type:complete
MIPLIGPIISAVSELGGSYLERKKVEATEKVKIARARVEGDIDWDVQQAKASAHSWKDEFLTIIFSIPLIMCFVPGLEQYALRGFEILDKTPDFYKYTLGVIVASSFAYRGATKFFGK